MHFEFTGYDENGEPTHVHTDDGFASTSRPFDSATDGWMKSQLRYEEFPAIRTGDDVRWLVDEVNRLRREVFHLKKIARI